MTISAAAPGRRAWIAAALAAGAGGWLALPRQASAQSALPRVIAQLRPSVVPVGTYSATDNPRFGFRGTGFAVGDGTLVATNLHVLPAPGELETANQGLAVGVPRPAAGGRPGGGAEEMATARRARLVASDRATDLALLRIDGPPLPPLALATADDGGAREGQSIGLMGFPVGGLLGYHPVTHRGIVAAVTMMAMPAPTSGQLDPRAVMRLRDGNFEVLQLDATAYPGNSGGPVFDADSGRVLGIVNLVLVKGSRESALASPTGISYAIPVRHLAELMRSVR